ncbi:MAG: YncE family protein [Alistipes sp.]|nr:YncE family protein [Alistipes sp.]
MRCLRYITVAFALLLSSCMRWEYGEQEQFNMLGEGVFITNEGNFTYGGASLSYYQPQTKHLENEVFYRANAMKLGDVAQSMVVRNGVGWVVVNNSHVLFAIDVETFREVGRITDLPSPRYICFASDDKAYISQIDSDRIIIVNPKTFEITGEIVCPMSTPYRTGSTEQMVIVGDYLFVTCWSYQKRILKIDTRTDEVVDYVDIGVQPKSIVADKNGKLWVVSDGGYEGNVIGYEAATLFCIDPTTLAVERRFELGLNSSGNATRTASRLKINDEGDTLYWIDGGVWRMAIDAEHLPVEPFIAPIVGASRSLYYALGVAPDTEEIYVGDALDYQQRSVIYRYSAEGKLLDTFTAGVIAGDFCWK